MRAQTAAGWMRNWAVVAAAVFAAGFAQAQATDQDIAGVLESMRAPAAAELPVVHRDDTGYLHFLSAPGGGHFAVPGGGAKSGGPAAAARAYVDAHKGAFGLLSPNGDLRVKRTKDRANGAVVRFSQTHAGLPVIGAEMVVRLTAGGGVAMVLNDTMKDPSVLDADLSLLVPGLTPEQAKAAALRAECALSQTEKSVYTVGEVPLLAVFSPPVFGMKGAPVLVYEVRLEDKTHAHASVAVSVDAKSGEMVFRRGLGAAALSREIYDAQGKLDPLASPELVREEGDDPTGDQYADALYDYFGDTYNWYKDNFGRDSYDDNGAMLKGYVNCPIFNAYWDSSEKIMVFDNRLLADDVAAHELTHAVTDAEVSFTYFGFSGALSEMYSDWGGEFVDLSNGRGNDSPELRWWIGEDMELLIPDSRGRDRNDPITEYPGLRYMKDPTVFSDPDRLGSPYLKNPFSMSDLGGVHSNNGIGNKLIYLLTDGDTFNGETVAGLGEELVGQLFYTAMGELSASADYYDLYLVLGSAANDLGVSFEDKLNIAAAARAVEIVPPELALLGLRDFRAVSAVDGDGQTSVALTWSNPAEEDLSNLTLLRNVGRFAQRIGEGTILPVPRGEDKYLDRAVEAGVEYYYTLIADITQSFPQIVYARVVAGAPAPNVLSQPFGYDPILGESDPMDLSFSQLTFTPVGSPSGGVSGDMPGIGYSNYEGTFRRNVYALPVARADADGGAFRLTFTDDNAVALVGGDVPFPYFGKKYLRMYIGANGYISFADVTPVPELNFPSLAAHFAIPRISFMFNDFSPSMGGAAWFRNLSDRMVLTFEDMPTWPYSVPTNTVGRTTVQVELFHSGQIRFTYLGVGAVDALVGLSDGAGFPRDPSAAFPDEGLQQAYTVPDLSALPAEQALLSFLPAPPVYAAVGEQIVFDMAVQRPAGLAGIPVLFGEWNGPGPVPFADLGNGAGRFSWTPQPDQKGLFTFRARTRLGGQQAFQDVSIYVGRSFARPSAGELAVSADTPFENPTQSRVVPLGRALTASYVYAHPEQAADSEYYAEGDSVIYWFRNGQVVISLIGRAVVPSNAPRASDRWWFGVVPVTRSGIVGDMVISPVVTIAGFPVITSVTPPYGLTLGGDRVTLLGERLSGVSRVTFGGVAGSNITVISDGELRVTSPLHVAGVVDVVAESVDGVGLASGAFRFIGDASGVPVTDVNKDGKVDAADVQLVTADVLRRNTKSVWVTDVNNDGQVNTLDVQLVVNSALFR